MATGSKGLDFLRDRRHEPVTLALLTLLAIVMTLAVTGLSRIYHGQQEALAVRWSARGVEDLKQQRFGAAVGEFRAALRYARDNDSYQLNLAEALLGERKTDEAYAYLINLWDREPENGLVTLELARIAASRGQTTRALRFYHNAIYAIWPGNQEEETRKSRLELIDYLLGIGAKAQAQAELIALEANLPEESPLQAHLGGLFLKAGDNEHALAAFRLALREDRHDAVALAGAGTAAFEQGRYLAAERYLKEAVAAAPDDVDSAARLATTETVLGLDPFRPQISAATRDRMTVKAFSAAGDRIRTCPALSGQPPHGRPDLVQQWNNLKPRVTEYGLRRNPDLVNSAMQLTFNIEQQTSGWCGAVTEADNALLLIAKLHEEH